MTGLAVGTAGEQPSVRNWCWLINPDRYDRRGLADHDRAMVGELGADLLRSRDCDEVVSERTVGRLLRPVKEACEALRWQSSTLEESRRSSTQAMGLILARSGELGTAYWQWSPTEWIELIGTSVERFLMPWPACLRRTTRPYVLAYGYLLGCFSDLHRIGRFHRNVLAWRAFGREPVDDAIDQVKKVQDR